MKYFAASFLIDNVNSLSCVLSISVAQDYLGIKGTVTVGRWDYYVDLIDLKAPGRRTSLDRNMVRLWQAFPLLSIMIFSSMVMLI